MIYDSPFRFLDCSDFLPLCIFHVPCFTVFTVFTVYSIFSFFFIFFHFFSFFSLFSLFSCFTFFTFFTLVYTFIFALLRLFAYRHGKAGGCFPVLPAGDHVQ